MGRSNVKSREEGLLHLYIDFDYLPAQQQAEILRLVPLIYERLIFPANIKMPYARDRQFDWPPLCIDSAETKNSIDFKFKPAGQYWPSLNTTKDGDLQILLPKWTIAPAATAAVLSVGMAFWDQTNDFYTEHIAGEDEAIHVPESKSQGRSNEYPFAPLQIDQLKDDKSVGNGQLKYLYREFRRQIDLPNIKSASINGYTIKEPSDK